MILIGFLVLLSMDIHGGQDFINRYRILIIGRLYVIQNQLLKMNFQVKIIISIYYYCLIVAIEDWNYAGTTTKDAYFRNIKVYDLESEDLDDTSVYSKYIALIINLDNSRNFRRICG